MLLPDKIHLQVCCEAKNDLAGIIVQMTVHAGRKNSYEIFFPKTDRDGRALISAEDFRDQFEEHIALALMDYDGSIESASQFVQLALFDPACMTANVESLLECPLSEGQQRRWQSPQEMLDYFLTCRNELFELTTANTSNLLICRTRPVGIPEDGKLNLTIRRKAGC